MKKKKEKETKKKAVREEKATAKRKKKSNNEEDLSVQYKREISKEKKDNENCRERTLLSAQLSFLKQLNEPLIGLHPGSGNLSSPVSSGAAPYLSLLGHQEPMISVVKNAQKSKGKRELDVDSFGDANMAGVPPEATTTQNVVVSPVIEGALSPTIPLGAASTPSRQVFLGAASTQSRQVFLGDAPSPSQVEKQEPRISGVKNAKKSRGRRGLDLDLFGDANMAGVPPRAATTQNVVVSPVARATLSPTVPLGAASKPSRQVFLGAASTQSRQVFLGAAPSSSPVEHQEAEPTISGVKNAQTSRGRRGLDLDSFGDANTAGVPPGAATTQNMVVSPVAATALSPTVPLGAASTQSPQVFPESS